MSAQRQTTMRGMAVAVTIQPPESTCLRTDELDVCCCICRHHADDLSHPITDGQQLSNKRGWVCLAPEFSGVISGWSEHGRCEMFDVTPEAGDLYAPKESGQ